ncbi:hypothetical protein Tco_1490974 [Tanacetum coccineum]
MDDPNITMKEYIRLEEEKARRNGKVYNWETATYGRIWDDNEVYNLKSVETKFPAIVFDDTFTSQAALSLHAITYNDALIEPSISPQHIDEFDLKNETSLSIYNEEELNVLYFNDLFPFNIIYPNDLKSDTDNDDNEIDMIQSSRDADITDFEERLGRIYGKEIHRVQVFDFEGLIELMADGLSGRMLMEHRDAQGHKAVLDLDIARALQFQLGGVRRRISWREFILGISSAGDFLGTTPSYTWIRDPMLRLCHMLIACSIAGRSQAPEKVTMIDLFYLREMDVGSVNIPYLLARYLRLFTSGRKHWAMISRVDEGALAILALAQVPQAPTAAGPAKTMAQRLGRLEEDVNGLGGALGEHREVLDSMACDFSQFTTWTVTGLSQMMD